MIAAWLAVALAGPLTGRITDGAGQGVADVQVVAYDHRFNYGTVRTGADGRFAMDMPAGEYRVRLIPPDGVNLAETWPPGILDICPAERFAVGEGLAPEVHQALPVGAVLSGQLVDGDGVGVPGLTLTNRTLEAQPKAVVRRATTDADGRFALPGLPADDEERVSGSFRLQVAGEGVPTQLVGPSYGLEAAPSWQVHPGDAVDIGRFTLLPGVTVSGSVDGPSGPILLGSVSAYSPSELVQVDIADGAYTASGLPPGEVMTWAKAPGFATTYLGDADRPDARVLVDEEGAVVTGLDITMPLESRLSGRLLGEQPLDGAVVQLLNSDGSVGVGAVVDEQGGFVVDALHPGLYTLNIFAAAQGYLDGPWTDAAGAPRPVEVVEGDSDLGEIELVPGARVEGVAVDPYTGEPVYGAAITATSVASGEPRTAITARDGSYALLGLEAGQWELAATFAAWCEPDPDFVDVYYPSEWRPIYPLPVELDAGEVVVWDPQMPSDRDHDGMADAWEVEHGLDPERDDSAEDPDGDGYSNLDEFVLGTDPTEAIGRGCACNAASGAPEWIMLLTLLSLRRRRR